MNFTNFNFSKQVLAGIEAANFSETMPVQEEVFAVALEETRDVAVQSHTGSGKTAAFLLTILEQFIREPEAKHKALIVAPTRELAVQIEQEAKLLGSGTDFTVGCFYGGVGYGKQEQLLREGVDIAIGTPGRLIDFGQSKKINFKEIDKVVIDEADRLFDMGFLPDLRRMLKQMKTPEQRQTMLFSATLSTRVERLAWEFMNNPEKIVIDADSITVDEISQVLYHVGIEEKMQLLLGILARENPDNALIFTNTKDMAVKVAKRLELNGYHALYIMGDLPQKKRLSIINKMKSGDLRILVATDVAARGLHINDLPLVVNYDIPEDPENYVHRIGRTARAGKSGKAISLACEKFVYGLAPIEEFIQMKIPVEWPDEEMLDVSDESKGIRVSGVDRGGRPGKGKNFSRKSSGRSGKPYSHKPSGGKPPERTQSGGNRPADQKPKPRQPVVKKEKAAPRPASKPQGQSAAPRKTPVKRPTVQSDKDSRLEYYRKKYGEDFQFSGSPEKKEPEKKEGVFGKMFGRKKK
jgi:ATP-dependent RNA helicase RhlB